jgi:hypothetical protein
LLQEFDGEAANCNCLEVGIGAIGRGKFEISWFNDEIQDFVSFVVAIWKIVWKERKPF